MLYHVILSLCGGGGVGVGGGIPSNYLVSTQLQLWLFCCWGCGCCWAVTISNLIRYFRFPQAWVRNFTMCALLYTLYTILYYSIHYNLSFAFVYKRASLKISKTVFIISKMLRIHIFSSSLFISVLSLAGFLAYFLHFYFK